jgi:hypothetical protein
MSDEVPARRPRRADRLPAIPRRAPAPRLAFKLHIERTLGETRRRTKVIGRLPDETSYLTLVWAVLDRASRGWRSLTMTSGGPAAARPAPLAARPAPPAPAAHCHRHPGSRPSRECQRHRLTSPSTGTAPVPLHRIPDATLCPHRRSVALSCPASQWQTEMSLPRRIVSPPGSLEACHGLVQRPVPQDRRRIVELAAGRHGGARSGDQEGSG